METVSTMALVLGLTEVVKRLGLPRKMLPLFAVVLGAGVAMLASGVTTTAILNGIVAGLSSMGLYSGTKATAGK